MKSFNVGGDEGILTKEGKITSAVIRVTPFVDWLSARMSPKEFISLPKDKKNKVFLLWKHKGSVNSIEDVESSDISFYISMKDTDEAQIEGMPEGVRKYIKRKINWHEYCLMLWKEAESGRIFAGERERELLREFGGRIEKE